MQDIDQNLPPTKEGVETGRWPWRRSSLTLVPEEFGVISLVVSD